VIFFGDILNFDLILIEFWVHQTYCATHWQ